MLRTLCKSFFSEGAVETYGSCFSLRFIKPLLYYEQNELLPESDSQFDDEIPIEWRESKTKLISAINRFLATHEKTTYNFLDKTRHDIESLIVNLEQAYSQGIESSEENPTSHKDPSAASATSSSAPDNSVASQPEVHPPQGINSDDFVNAFFNRMQGATESRKLKVSDLGYFYPDAPLNWGEEAIITYNGQQYYRSAASFTNRVQNLVALKKWPAVSDVIDPSLMGAARIWWDQTLQNVTRTGILKSVDEKELVKALNERFRPPPSESFAALYRTQYGINECRERKDIADYIGQIQAASKAIGGAHDTPASIVLHAWRQIDIVLRENIPELHLRRPWKTSLRKNQKTVLDAFNQLQRQMSKAGFYIGPNGPNAFNPNNPYQPNNQDNYYPRPNFNNTFAARGPNAGNNSYNPYNRNAENANFRNNRSNNWPNQNNPYRQKYSQLQGTFSPNSPSNMPQQRAIEGNRANQNQQHWGNKPNQAQQPWQNRQSQRLLGAPASANLADTDTDTSSSNPVNTGQPDFMAGCDDQQGFGYQLGYDPEREGFSYFTSATHMTPAKSKPKMHICKVCREEFSSRNKLFTHLTERGHKQSRSFKSTASQQAELTNFTTRFSTRTAPTPSVTPEPIEKRSATPQFEVGSGIGYRGYTYTTIQIRTAAKPLIVRGIANNKYTTSDYVLLELCVPGKDTKTGVPADAVFTREFHLVDDLQANTLVGNDILYPEKCDLIYSKKQLLVNSCGVEVPMQVHVRQGSAVKAQLVHFKKTMIVPPHSSMVVPIHKISKDRDLFFEPEQSDHVSLFVFLVSQDTTGILVKNDSPQRRKINFFKKALATTVAAYTALTSSTVKTTVSPNTTAASATFSTVEAPIRPSVTPDSVPSKR
ncbi:hypothetical protein SBOR_3682 [Sclerotinia borealis F-4128]|uniref:C2H2-type domain-containing protein n=1 Tax=Sclerotinia borealis (strain F-4128) TaxID=1432307 RepID=W9CMQ7_SCLBF|nr:hypothetical protein SBOR_3682 [Sclerotinia borealis F-4128]